MSSLSIVLGALLPWATLRASTYVLRQDGHGLVHEGFLQMMRRNERPEAELLWLAPNLDAPDGHPAIWNKLLSHLAHEAGSQGIERIYADVPDQPLLVNTFAAVGFQPFCRQTIWRCYEPGRGAAGAEAAGSAAHPRTSGDDWDLLRLYMATVPETVQNAEGAIGAPTSVAPIVENLRPDQGVTYVVRAVDELLGAFQLLRGVHGAWLHIWIDTLQPDGCKVRTFFEHVLAVASVQPWARPLYFAASDYQGGLDSLLEELGFAPFLDRVRMVKHVIKWVRESTPSSIPVVESVGEVAPTSFAPPGVATTIATTIDSGSSA